MQTLGIIPARYGSKRLPNKNVADLGGRPLIAWTIEAAIKSKIFDRIVLSTDSESIGSLADEIAGMPIYLPRPLELSRDDTPSLDVVKYIASYIPSDVICLLQPTSPFRTSDDIVEAYTMLKHMQGDAVVSVTDGPYDLAFQVGYANRMRPREDIVVANGALYLIRTDALLRGEDWYSGISYAYRMPKDRSLDIDTEADLQLARAIIAQREAA